MTLYVGASRTNRIRELPIPMHGFFVGFRDVRGLLLYFDDATALGVVLAPVEGFAGLLGLSYNGFAAAVGADRGGGCVGRNTLVAFFQIADMGRAGLVADGGLPFTNDFSHFGDLFGFNKGRGKGEDVFGNASAVVNAGGHFVFKVAATGEGNDVVEVALVDAEVVGQRADVFVVLAQGVLESALLAIDGLGPLGALFIAEDPAGVGLGLNHEDTGGANDNVVDLGGCAVGQGKVDVVEDDVLFREAVFQSARNESLPANPALRRAVEPQKKDFKENNKNNQCN